MLKFKSVTKKEELKEGDYVILDGISPHKIDCMDGSFMFLQYFQDIDIADKRGVRYDVEALIERAALHKIISE